jgi:hypothetical protein
MGIAYILVRSNDMCLLCGIIVLFPEINDNVLGDLNYNHNIFPEIREL